MKKYIIKNCPALSYGKALRFKKCYRTNWKEFCQDCPDCLLKRIVELCANKYYKDIYELEGKILNLLEIEGAE